MTIAASDAAATAVVANCDIVSYRRRHAMTSAIMITAICSTVLAIVIVIIVRSKGMSCFSTTVPTITTTIFALARFKSTQEQTIQ